MNGLLKLYNKLGRWGNVILLGLLILSGLANRLFMSIKPDFADYKIEIFIIALALYFVYRIYKMSKFEITNHKFFKLILLLGIIFRIIFAIHDFYNRPVQISDYAKHEKLGARIAFEGEFYDFAGVELRNFRQPGLPAMFALGLLVYNNPVTYSVIMILFSFGVLISGYYLFRDLKNIAALLSFGYISVSPNMLFMASSSNTQLSFFFFIILLFITLKLYKGKFYQLIIIGALLAAEMYIRFNFLMIIILIPFMLDKHSGESNLAALKKFAYVLIFFILFYSPWIYRNYNVYGTIRLMSTEGPRFYSSNVIYDYTNAGGYNGIPDSVINKYKNLNEIEFDKALNNETINFIRNNPGIYLKGIPFRVMKYSGRQDWTIGYFFENTKYENGKLMDSLFQAIENLFFWIILFYPFIFLIKNKINQPLPVYVLWAFLIYSMILIPISETRARYNFPYILFPLFAISLIKRDDEKHQIN